MEADSPEVQPTAPLPLNQAYSLIIHNVDNPPFLGPIAQISHLGTMLVPHGAFTSKGMASMFQCLNWDPPAFPHSCSPLVQDWMILGTQHCWKP